MVAASAARPGMNQLVQELGNRQTPITAGETQNYCYRVILFILCNNQSIIGDIDWMDTFFAPGVRRRNNIESIL